MFLNDLNRNEDNRMRIKIVIGGVKVKALITESETIINPQNNSLNKRHFFFVEFDKLTTQFFSKSFIQFSFFLIFY